VQSDTLRLLRHAAPYKSQIGGALAVALLGAAMEVARPWPTKAIVDYAIAAKPLPHWLASLTGLLPSLATRPGIIFWSVVAGALLVVGAAAASFAAQVFVFRVAMEMVLDLSRKVFSRVQRLSLSFHQRHAVGDLTQRVGSDVFVVQAAVCSVAVPAAASALSLLGMIFLMLRLDPVLSLVTLSIIPLLGVSLLFFQKPMRTASETQWRRQGDIMAFLEQSLSGIRLIQGYAREPYIEQRMSKQGRLLTEAYARSLKVGAGYGQVTAIVTGLLAVVLIGVGSTRVLANRLTLGDLLVFLGYLASITTPITAIAGAINTATALNSRGRRVLDILDSADEIPEPAKPVKLERVRGDIEFDRVSFGYPDTAENGSAPPARLVFTDISFRASAGQVTAIIGITGAGKSSMVSLLSRFYDPTSGVVRLDGRDLRDYSVRSLRERVAIVSQDPVLFPMTIEENIAFGRPGASREEIIAAAKIARAHEFIEALPEGYDSEIAERGASLSGGERQRISLARALLKDAPILILDEPTSSLDAHTESEIFADLAAHIEGKTTFIISHRLSTIRRADQILSLEDGHIVERGTHEMLLAGSGVYSRLYENQNIAAL
jgi:ABC-type multidrug transport system fused ATPase/permease subunit